MTAQPVSRAGDLDRHPPAGRRALVVSAQPAGPGASPSNDKEAPLDDHAAEPRSDSGAACREPLTARGQARAGLTPSRPRLLDLFCGAGGAAMGYHRAGFDVVGVDLVPQPHYPFEFVQDDAMALLASPYSPLGDFDAVHASPPCQDHSALAARVGTHGTGWMLAAALELLRPLSVPWVVENVVGPTVTMGGWWFILCGSSFDLRVRRHRRFGSNTLMMPPPCRHADQGTPLGVYGHGGGGQMTRGFKAETRDYAELMGMPWATSREVVQAIPPAYTEWIGAQLLEAVARV